MHKFFEAHTTFCSHASWGGQTPQGLKMRLHASDFGPCGTTTIAQHTGLRLDQSLSWLSQCSETETSNIKDIILVSTWLGRSHHDQHIIKIMNIKKRCNKSKQRLRFEKYTSAHTWRTSSGASACSFSICTISLRCLDDDMLCPRSAVWKHMHSSSVGRRVMFSLLRRSTESMQYVGSDNFIADMIHRIPSET